MSNDDFLLPPAPPVKPPSSLSRKVGLGAALIVLPLGTAWIYNQLRAQGDKQNADEEHGASYDVSALRKIDPALIKYQQITLVATGLQAARAMAIAPDGRLLVAGDRILRSFSPTGEKLSDLTLNAVPYCVANGTDGTIYVGFKDHVEVFSADGKPVKIWPGFGDRAHLSGLAVRGQEIFVADSGRRIVVRCDLDGLVLGELAGRDESRGNSGLVLPSPHLNVAAGSDGQVLISNPGRHRIESYSIDGALQRFFGKGGTGIDDFLGCCNPSNFALLSDGRIVTAEKGIARVKIYQPDGRLDCVVAGPDVFGDNMLGLELAVDRLDHIFVLEPGSTSVRIFAPTKASTP